MFDIVYYLYIVFYNFENAISKLLNPDSKYNVSSFLRTSIKMLEACIHFLDSLTDIKRKSTHATYKNLPNKDHRSLETRNYTDFVWKNVDHMTVYTDHMT